MTGRFVDSRLLADTLACAMTPRDPVRDCRSSYDAVAETYATRIAGELAGKPFDRDLLRRFAALVGQSGTICDAGCGPGHVTRFLADCGATVTGIDLSPEMVRVARTRHPDLNFRPGDLRALDFAPGSWDGLVAFYSIIHLTPEDRPRAWREFHRVLRPGGRLLLAFHIGAETVHLDEWWGHRVSVDFHFLSPGEISAQLAAAGFVVDECLERAPYAPAIEHQSRRCYLLAHRPAATSTPPAPTAP
jgi:SAM-dependent methyltransferase